MPRARRELHWFAGDDDGEWRKRCEETAATFFDEEPGGAKLFCVFAGELVVGDESDAAGFEDTDDLLECLAAGGRVVDVVKAEIGDDNVEGGVREGHCLCRLTD